MLIMLQSSKAEQGNIQPLATHADLKYTVANKIISS